MSSWTRRTLTYVPDKSHGTVEEYRDKEEYFIQQWYKDLQVLRIQEMLDSYNNFFVAQTR